MLTLAVRNILRKKRHTAATLAAIVFGVAGLILAGGWVNDILLTLGEALIHSQSGHLQIYKQGFFQVGSRFPEKYLIEKPDQISQSIEGVSEIDYTMSRLTFSGLLSNGRSDMPIIGEGVEPGKEARLGSWVKTTKGRRLADTDKFGIEIGQGLAKSLNLSPGDSVTILANTLEGALNNLEFDVVGVFQTFSNDYDAHAVKIPLGAAQDLVATKQVNALVIVLKKTADTDPIVKKFGSQLAAEGLEIKTWVELNDFYEKTVDLYRRQFGVMQLIILFMVLLGVANSVNMNVFERVGEFGTMMSLGNRSDHVFRTIMSENILLGLTGGTIGVALGVGLSLAISHVGIPMPPLPNANIGYTARIEIVPTALIISSAIGFAATVLAAIFPAMKVSRMPVVDALRHNI